MSASIKRGLHYKIHTHLIPSRRNQYRPHLLRNPLLLLTSGILALILITTTLVGIRIEPVAELTVVEIQQRIIENINQAREEQGGLPPLIYNRRLSAAAASKQEHMRTNDYWAHTSPTGTEPWEFIKNQHVSYTLASETLARGFSSPEGVVEGWLDSPSHRQALLERSYSQIGLSVTEEDHGYEAVALFIQPSTSISTASGVLSETTQTPTQAVLAVQAPQLSKINDSFPWYIVAGLIVCMAISVVVSIWVLLRQRHAQPHHLQHRSLHELPEIHLVLHVGVFLLLISATL